MFKYLSYNLFSIINIISFFIMVDILNNTIFNLFFYFCKISLLIILNIILIIEFFFIKTKYFQTYYKTYTLLEIFKNINQNEIFFNYNNLTYSFSFKYNIVEVKYNINFFNKNNSLIKPSDLTLFNKMHIVCHMNKVNITSIDSLAYIYQNTFYCVEYFKIKDKIQFGIKIYIENLENKTIYFFNSDIIKYKIKNQNNYKFDPFYINLNYKNIFDKVNDLNNNNNLINSFNLKKLYIERPYCLDKFNNLFKNDVWYFKNIYNKYFCFCKGLCPYSKISQLCKYIFYLVIIDGNKHLYNKTHYLLSDFYFRSSDDTYPIFEEMIKNNISAHYIDGKKYIYKKYCDKEKYCLKIISLINKNIMIDGDFLENYLDLILRLKAVIVGHEISSFYNIFYNIDYIDYINLGHGVKYIKHFLYSNYSSYKKYNKLVLPPSEKIISIAKRYGWSDENIIKICLPKWDKYNIYKKKMLLNKNKSIFIMFTWRNLKNKKYSISPTYINNIINLINDNVMLSTLKQYNIILYFTLHPNFRKYKKKIKLNKLVKYIQTAEISNILMESNLLISDFSSIIFDMIYQYKPYILYIPDIYDKKIKYIYEEGYYDIINSFKNGSLYFENIYYNIREIVNKLIYYIENNFKLDSKLKKFYESFQLRCNNNTKAFVKYIINS